MHAAILAFGWQPEIRGITVVLIAVTVLCGSVYLLLATNTGSRLGFLIALAGLFGWLTVMGSIWWVYGIGLRGKDPTWKPVEVIVGDLGQANNPVARSLGQWAKLSPDNPGRGQAQAAADDILLNQAKVFKNTTDYVPIDVYSVGGHSYPRWFFDFFHTAHYALAQVQAVVPQPTEEGKAPPRPVADTNQPVISVLMLRDLGYRRRPAALVTAGSLIIFLLLVYMLHSRDKRSMQARSMALERIDG